MIVCVLMCMCIRWFRRSLMKDREQKKIPTLRPNLKSILLLTVTYFQYYLFSVQVLHMKQLLFSFFGAFGAARLRLRYG